MRGAGALSLVIAVVAGAVYLNSLSGDFVWDDRKLIVDDHAIKTWTRLDDIFSHDFFDRREDDLPYGYYRPVVTLTYLVDFSLWGLRPAGYHLTNVLLHAANSALVVAVLLALGWSAFAAGIAGLLFAVHPMHSENVAWIAGRTDLVAFFFCAVALRLHLAATGGTRRRSGFVALATVAFALGLLAKEMSVVLVGWIAAAEAIGRRQPPPAVLRASAPYITVFAAYALWRFAALDVAVPGVPAEHNVAAVVLTAPPTILRYLAWLALPVGHNAYVLNPYVRTLADPRLWLALVVLGGLALLSRRSAPTSPRAALAAAMLAVAFLPILNVVRVAGPADMGDVMAERFLYFPSFPFVALVGLGLAAAVQRAVARPLARWALAAIPVALLAVATVGRNRVWHDELTFFTATLRQSPRAALLWCNLATYHLRNGNLAAAATAIDRAAEVDAESYAVLSSRALWFVLSGRQAEAIPLQEAIVRDARRGKTAALNNLAYLYRTSGREAEARDLLERLVAKGHGSADVYFNLAEIYRGRGELEGARGAYRLALEDRPQDLDAATALAQLEMDQGRPDEAERIYRGLLRSYPDDARLLNNVALTRYHGGDTAGALDLLRRAIEAEPDYVRARINYAQLLQTAGRPADALAEMEAAARLAAGTELEPMATEQLAAMRGARPAALAPEGR